MLNDPISHIEAIAPGFIFEGSDAPDITTEGHLVEI